MKDIELYFWVNIWEYPFPAKLFWGVTLAGIVDSQYFAAYRIISTGRERGRGNELFNMALNICSYTKKRFLLE